MLILDTVNRSLQFVLSAVVTTNHLQFVASYIDITTTAFTPGTTTGVSNNTTAVTLAAAPAASTQRQLKQIGIYNADTVQAAITVQFNDNATLRSLLKVTLQPYETLTYLDGLGWKVTDTDGRVKENATALSGNIVSAKQAVVNFGGVPTNEKSFTVVDPTVSAGTPILAVQSGEATLDKGLSADENEMDPILFSASPGAGRFTLFGAARDGAVLGQFKVNYIVFPTGSPISSVSGPNNLSVATMAWYKASDFDTSVDGSDVSQWNDSSGQNNHAPALGGAGARPLVTKNAVGGMTALKSVNGTTRGLKTAVGALSPSGITVYNTPWSVFTVLKVSTSAADRAYFDLENGGGYDLRGEFLSATNRLSIRDDATTPSTQLGSIVVGTWYYLVWVYDGTNLSLYINGVNTGLTLTTGSAWLTTIRNDIYLLETSTGASVTFDGFMAEFALYHSNLTSADVVLLTKYVQARYGLA